KQTGIKLRVVKPEHAQYIEKFSTMFMSNDIPDIVEVPPQDYMRIASQKVLSPLKKYIEESPTLSKVLKTNPDVINALEYKGEIYGVQKEIGNGSLVYVRKDWLDTLKISMPKNYDEFYNMLVAFRDKDPDGNGKKDTIGFTASMKDQYSNEGFLAPILVDARLGFYKKDGKWVDGFSEDAMLKAMERMAKLYKEGLIEPDVFTLATADTRNKFYTGNTGCFSYWAGGWNDTINLNLKNNIPTASVVAMPALEGGYFFNRIAPSFAIPAKCASGNPEAVFKYFFDYIYDGGKGTMWATSGVEGVHYKMENGKPVALPALSAPEKARNVPVKTMIAGEGTIVPNPGYTFPLTDDCKNSSAVFAASAKTWDLVPPTPTFTKYNADILLLRQSVLAEVMKGVITPAAGMEKYKTTMKQYEIDKIIEEINNF
ncbi:MAG TPA: hypothetical protein DCP97_05355, partial [Ruminococcaceae bacterium]|nr:hypothetical protein [Oscillospiraceae bacterium]